MITIVVVVENEIEVLWMVIEELKIPFTLKFCPISNSSEGILQKKCFVCNVDRGKCPIMVLHVKILSVKNKQAEESILLPTKRDNAYKFKRKYEKSFFK